MNSLPPEAKLDVLKFLDFEQLFSVKQTNFYFRNFIKEYDEKLAKMKFYQLLLFNIKESSFLNILPCRKLIEPNQELYNFELSEQLEKKWKNAIEKAIPLCLSIYGFGVNTVVCKPEKATRKEFLHLQLPNFPKNMKEMKIARYYMEQLFNHAFEYVEFNHVIFNPEMIKLLFDDKPLQLHIKKANLYIDNEQHKCFLKFALDHLMANELGIYFAKVNYMGQYTDILFKILTNGGNKFSTVCIQGFKLSELYNPIIQHIEMSRNCSKIVANIIIGCDVGLYINLSEQAENIKNLHKFTKYQLSNKYNPKMRFSIYNGQYKNGLVYAEIKKISG